MKAQNTLLCIIAALADEAEVDPLERGAAPKIAEMTELTGAAVGADTVKKYLDMIPNAIERRTK